MEFLVENNESGMAFFSLTPMIVDPGFILFNVAWFSFNLVEHLFLFGAFSLNELKIQPLLPFEGQQREKKTYWKTNIVWIETHCIFGLGFTIWLNASKHSWRSLGASSISLVLKVFPTRASMLISAWIHKDEHGLVKPEDCSDFLRPVLHRLTTN